MTRITLGLLATVVAVSALLGTCVSPAAAVAIKRCGAVVGPKVRIGATSFDHYGVFGVKVDCGFAKKSVSTIVKQKLANSPTPVRVKGQNGWICVAQEVVRQVAVAGHCQRGRSSVLSWVGVGVHL